MAETIEILKPQEPLKRGDKYIFPLTSSDQIILSGEDSAEGERFTLSNVVKQGIENADTGEAPLVNADLLGGNIKSEDIINIQNQVSELNQHLADKIKIQITEKTNFSVPANYAGWITNLTPTDTSYNWYIVGAYTGTAHVSVDGLAPHDIHIRSNTSSAETTNIVAICLGVHK